MQIEKIRPAVEEKLKDMGFELFDMRFFQAGTRSILRITIDRQGGVTIADCEHVSNEISIVIDVENWTTHPYTLEVSSPGIDRQLKTERDFNRIKGRFVVVHMREGVDGKKTLAGEVAVCEDGKLSLKVENTIFEIPLSDIYSGKEEIRFK